jgi:hypothetical protein
MRREYLSLVTNDGVVHVVERTYGTYGAFRTGDIGLCITAHESRGRILHEGMPPTCIECIAKEMYVRSRY